MSLESGKTLAKPVPHIGHTAHYEMLVRIEQYQLEQFSRFYQLEQFSRFLDKLRSINESNSDARYLLDENLSIVSFLDSDFTIVNSVLAKHDYGGRDLVKLVVASELFRSR